MQQGKNYQQIPNFNFIPREQRRPAISPRRLSLRLVLVLLLVGEVVLISTLFWQRFALGAAFESSRQEIQQLEAKLVAKARLQETGVKNPEAVLKALREKRQAWAEDWKELGMEQPDWSQVLAALFKAKPEGVELASVQQGTAVVNVTGTASNYQALLEYHRGLVASPVVAYVSRLKSEKAGASIRFSLEVTVKG